MAFDLTKLPAWYLEKYGRDKLCEVLKQVPSVVAMWTKSNKFPLSAVQELLTFDPAPLGEIVPLYSHPDPAQKLMILVPLSNPPAPKMMDSLMRLYDKREMGFERFSYNCVSVSRNVLAARWLRSDAPYAWWQDGDTAVPSGDAAWFREAAEVPDMPEVFAGINSIYRALWHKKTILSCCYVSRRKGGSPQFGGGSSPEMRALVKRGPVDRVIEVPWSGFGGILTHRKVFDDIIDTQGDEIRMKPGGIGSFFGENCNYEYGFFSPTDRETPGDDLPFCQRAKRAGHSVFVDLAIHAAHIGDRPFTYKDL